ncbi:DUF11 domain-containing protein [Methanolobus halotolerans]|uniref:DUF11 domain-containing protein n=1 Tax=Methanolobus halotolerans TaxID=2052935 RepID=A0A4E0Q559_9EURY|nr:DUF11 domain-containing protein [Methanolobus halotolerans]TGC09175.1 hypothetical protein CUN85_07360 [Methanolobus halotolerans]
MRQLLFKPVLLVVLVLLCGQAGAQSTTDDIEWLEAEEFTLYWGEEVNASGYLITALDFSPSRASDTDTDYVMLSVMSNSSESWGTILALNNSDIPDNYVFDDRLNITAVEIITGNDIPVPYTTISVAIANRSLAQAKIVKKIDATISVVEKRSDEIYMDERAHIEVNIKNLGGIPLENVELISSIPQEFILDPDIDQVRNFSMAAYGQKTVRYSLKALKPGTYNFSGTRVLVNMEGRTYTKTLNNSEIIVHGPFLNLVKSVSADSVQVGDVLDVNVIVKNEGNRATYVSVSDEIPPGAVLVSGETSGGKVLHPADSLDLTYSVRMKMAGNIVIPSVKVKSVDSKEYEDTVYSRRFLLQVSDPSQSSDSDRFENDRDGPADGQFENNYAEDTVPTAETEKEDYGKFQFFFDLLDSIKGYLGNIN